MRHIAPVPERVRGQGNVKPAVLHEALGYASQVASPAERRGGAAPHEEAQRACSPSQRSRSELHLTELRREGDTRGGSRHARLN